MGLMGPMGLIGLISLLAACSAEGPDLQEQERKSAGEGEKTVLILLCMPFHTSPPFKGMSCT